MSGIPKIVFTGGPCAGKSTAIVRIAKDLKERGYTPIVVPEAATALMNAGFTIADLGVHTFQKILICLQAEQERIYQSGALVLQQKRPVLICDRGQLDGKGYMEDEDFAQMLSELGCNESDLYQSYDAVFHLETVARSFPQTYSNANNATRYESRQQAVAVEDRLCGIWSQHPRFYHIKATETFSQKYDCLCQALFELLDTLDKERSIQLCQL